MIETAVLVMPFFSADEGEERERSLFVESLFQQLSVYFNFNVKTIHPEVSGQQTLGKSYYEHLSQCDLVIADLYSNNQNVAVEVTISCLHSIHTYLMAPHRGKDERHNVAAYFNPYIGFKYLETDVKELKTHVETNLNAPSDKGQWYNQLMNENSSEFDAFKSWFMRYCENGVGTFSFLNSLLRDFERIQNGRFAFGKPLLDEMNQSPFTQLDTISHLMILESMAKEVWIFANDVTVGIEDYVQSIMLKNLLKNTEYRYIVPDETEVHLNVELLQADIEKRLKDKDVDQSDLINNFSVKYVPKQLLSHEITMLDPTKGRLSAYLLEIYDDARYVLRLSDSEASKVRARHKRLWDFDWSVTSKRR